MCERARARAQECIVRERGGQGIITLTYIGIFSRRKSVLSAR